MVELPLVHGDVKTSVRQVVGTGAIAAEAGARVGRLAAAVIREGMGVWSTCEVRTGRSKPAEEAAGTEATAALMRVEAGAETLSEAVVSGAGAAVAGADMEAGAETVETGGEEADRVGQGGEAIPVKESNLWRPSPSAATRERDSGLVFVTLPH